MSAKPPDNSLITIALNDLAFRTLNSLPYEPSKSTAEAIDRLAEQIRRGSLAQAAAVCDLAQAIRETT